MATPRNETFDARLVGADGKKLQRLDIGAGAEAEAFKQALETAAFTVTSVEAKPVKRHPYPPFTTSTLQQEASRKHGFAPAHTMRVAQRLYEGVDIGGETVGLITYMRTDGVQIAEEAIGAVRSVIASDYGKDYVPGAPRRYETKAKNAQEAHEAIRPTELTRRPRETKSFLDADQAKLYELIWLRTVASQMESAELERTTADIEAKVASRILDLRATGTVVKFDGFLTLYNEDRDEDPEDEEARRLPAMSQGEKLAKRSIAADQHFTEPPPRYSEASLVKRLEELGIGRPSTYASILQVLKDRKYVRLDKRRLVPEDRGRIVVAFLESFFARYVEYDFTAGLEDKLDLISNSEIAWRDVLRDFWQDFIGAIDETKDLKISQVIDALDALLSQHLYPAREDGVDPKVCPTCSHRAAVAEALEIRRLYRLLELSGMPLHPLAVGVRRRRRYRREEARRGSGNRARYHGARRPLRPLSAAWRDDQGRREAQARWPAQRRRARRDRSQARAVFAVAAARRRQASRRRRADQGRHRPLRALRAARQDLREPGIARGRVHHRAQSRGDADRREEGQGSAQALRRGSGPVARRPSEPRRADRGEEGPLWALCQP